MREKYIHIYLVQIHLYIKTHSICDAEAEQKTIKLNWHIKINYRNVSANYQPKREQHIRIKVNI